MDIATGIDTKKGLRAPKAQRTEKVTPEELAAAIRATIEDFVANVPGVETVGDIGNGNCFDFAEAVFRRLGAESDYCHGGCSGLSLGETDDFWKEDFVADLDRWRRAGESLPDDIPEDELADLLGSATHQWVVLCGRHHDATAPEGVDRILDMPFFADQIDALRRRMSAAAPGPR